MNVNKRNSIRKQLKLYVDIYSFDKYLGLHQTRDMNLDGAFIDNSFRKLNPGDLLELHFHVQDGELNHLRLKATVSRSSDEGVGVVFDYGVQEYRQLLNTISTFANDGHIRRIPGFWYMDSSVNQPADEKRIGKYGYVQGRQDQKISVATVSSVIVSSVGIANTEKAIDIYSRRGAEDAKKEE